MAAPTLKSDNCSETVDAETSSMMHNHVSAAAVDARDTCTFTCLADSGLFSLVPVQVWWRHSGPVKQAFANCSGSVYTDLMPPFLMPSIQK